jgi:uncharacterized membrane protein
MAKISSYPSDANVTTSDRLIGSDNENSNETKNFAVGDIINLAQSIIGPNFVPYTGATGNVDLGNNSLDADVINAGDVYANNLFNSGGNPSVFVGDDSASPVGLLINTSTKTFKLGDYNGNFNATHIAIEDSSSRITFVGGFNLSNGQGTAGQVLTSAGAGATPTWTSLPNFSTFVPYTGATTNVDLGGYGLTTSYLTSTLGIRTDGAISLNGDEGGIGEVLISTGAGSVPVWTDINGLITSNLYKGSFYDTITQTLTGGANVAVPVILRDTDALSTNGISIVTDGTNLSRITFANAGTYNILFSAQLANSAGTSQTVDFWLRQNGSTAAANIPNTNGKVLLQGNANYLMAAWNYFVTVAAGDYIQLMWTATSTNITMVADAATAVHPATPSIILTANIV